MSGFLTAVGFMMGVITLIVAIVLLERKRAAMDLEARRRLLEAFHIPVTPIARAASGRRVRVVGRVHIEGEPLRGPLSARPCAYYEVIIEKFDSRQSQWFSFADERRGRLFVLRDESGEIEVRMIGVQAFVDHDHSVDEERWNSEGDDIRPVLVRNGLSSALERRLTRMRGKEGILQEGELITVIGVAQAIEQEEQLASPAYRSRPARLRLEAPPNGRLLLTDDPDTVRFGTEDQSVRT